MLAKDKIIKPECNPNNNLAIRVYYAISKYYLEPLKKFFEIGSRSLRAYPDHLV